MTLSAVAPVMHYASLLPTSCPHYSFLVSTYPQSQSIRLSYRMPCSSLLPGLLSPVKARGWLPSVTPSRLLGDEADAQEVAYGTYMCLANIELQHSILTTMTVHGGPRVAEPRRNALIPDTTKYHTIQDIYGQILAEPRASDQADWVRYRESILYPRLIAYAIRVEKANPGKEVWIVKDNAPMNSGAPSMISADANPTCEWGAGMTYMFFFSNNTHTIAQLTTRSPDVAGRYNADCIHVFPRGGYVASHSVSANICGLLFGSR